jgi:ubiquinone/menaquinone biosynthesis C-methylase UbiE
MMDIIYMKNNIKRDFDKEADSWDDKPQRVKLASDISKSILREIVLTPAMDVLDFGCGTGLVSLQLRPQVRSVTGFDSSQGMLNVFKKKIVQQNLTGVEVHHLDFDKGDCIKGEYHLVVSSMTLHHIKDIRPIMDQFYKVLFPSGYICLADLDPDNGKFHDTDDGIFHHGFEREAMKNVIRLAGFTDVRDVQAAEVNKTGADGIARRFSVFLMIGRKH